MYTTCIVIIQYFRKLKLFLLKYFSKPDSPKTNRNRNQKRAMRDECAPQSNTSAPVRKPARATANKIRKILFAQKFRRLRLGLVEQLELFEE